MIVKTRWGMESLEIYIADNLNEIDVFYKKIKRDIEKVIRNMNINKI